MGRVSWDHAEECDHVLLLASAGSRCRRLRDRIGRVPGRVHAQALGRYPRFRILSAMSAADARRRAGSSVTVAALDLDVPGGGALETIRALRAARPSLAILAFRATDAASDAIASTMAGADIFHVCREKDFPGFERALDLAISRRRVSDELARTEAEMAEARARLSRISTELVQAIPGFRPLHAREEVVPFREAARRYLLSSARLFDGDPRGLARSLGLSYFALRRLLARYDVPFPTSRRRA